jgi:serine/threonine-protein kinase
MGVVVGARHLQLDTRVAIKFLLPGTLTDSDAMARFSREARAAVRITNEHVARVLDVGELEDGSPYIVMEFLEGADLATRLRSQGQLSIEEAVEVIIQTCEALAEAHGLGIVHRDLKPANLFCIRRPDGLPWIKVLDFGISKLTSDDPFSQGGITQSAVVMGSPAYMSPEQMQSARYVDARTDIWALGVVLFELLAGQAPFQGESLADIILRVSTRPVPSLREARRDCPTKLEDVVKKCLEKDRNTRFVDVAALAVALLPFAPDRARVSVERIARTTHRDTGSSTVTTLGIEPGSLPPLLPSGTSSALGLTNAPRNTRGLPRSGLVAILGAGALVAGGMLLLVTRPREKPVPATTVTSGSEPLSPPPVYSIAVPTEPSTKPESLEPLRLPEATSPIASAPSARPTASAVAPSLPPRLQLQRPTPQPKHPPVHSSTHEDVY